MKHVKWLAPLALAFALLPAHAQTWSKLNTGISRGTSPNQIGVDIGTNASSYVPIGNIVAGAFYLPYTQVSGLYPYGTGAAGTGANATAATFSASNQALWLVGNYTGSGTGPFAEISATDTANSGGSIFPNTALRIDHNVNSGAGAGNRNTLLPILTKNVAIAGSDGTKKFYTPFFSQMYAYAGDGGSPGTPLGSYYGMSSILQLLSGATYVSSAAGGEIDVSVATGASVDLKVGLLLASVNNDAVNGTSYDGFLAFGADATTTAKWTYGITFGWPKGPWAFDTSSTLIGSVASTTSRVANYGVDFSGVTFSTGAFKSTGFLVNPTGATTVASLASTAGITATTGAFSGAVTATDVTASGTLAGAALSTSAPVTKTANYTVDSGAAKDSSIIFNGAGSLTVTLPTASSFSGRLIRIKTIAAQTVVSASSNVVPLVGGAAGTAILAATAGKWATLQSDGTNWIIMEGN